MRYPPPFLAWLAISVCGLDAGRGNFLSKIFGGRLRDSATARPDLAARCCVRSARATSRSVRLAGNFRREKAAPRKAPLRIARKDARDATEPMASAAPHRF